MKKALISLLLGVTLVGGLAGCGNKTLIEDKEVNTPIAEELEETEEEKIEYVINIVNKTFNEIDNELNSTGGNFLTSTKVFYEENTRTIQVVQTVTSITEITDEEFVMAYKFGNSDSLFESFNSNCLFKYEQVKELVDLKELKNINIVITQNQGDYKIYEIKNGVETYRITQQ